MATPVLAGPTPDEVIAAIKKLGGGVTVDNDKAVVSVSLSDTQVTDAGVEKLRQALPKCFIYR